MAGRGGESGLMEAPVAGVELRPANPSDVELVFRWRNDPIIVARSSSQTTVLPEEHRRWFSASLQDPHRLLFIIAIDSSPSGLIRFDKIDAESAVISVYLQANYYLRVRGYSQMHLKLKEF